MTEEEIGRWKSHYAEAKAALEALPSLIDDPVGHRESWQELSDHLEAMQDLCPPQTKPIGPIDG